jgi:glucan phosphoethanolaminetransferase (alkaline phosphatase superfamily)
MNAGQASTIPDKLAKIVSIVFHPLFMPLYGLAILFFAPTFLKYLPVEAKRILFLVMLIDNVFLPLALFPFLRYRNLISSYHIDDRKERIIPLLITSILYCTTSFIVFRYQIPFFLKSFIFATSVVAIVVSMINFWWKISIHAVGAGALTATVFALSLKMHTPLTWYLLVVIFASGLILSSRLRLNEHNPSQVWVGFLTGFMGISLFILFI